MFYFKVRKKIWGVIFHLRSTRSAQATNSLYRKVAKVHCSPPKTQNKQLYSRKVIFKLLVTRLIVVIPLCGCRRHQRYHIWLINHVCAIGKGRKSSLLLARDTKQTSFIHAKLFHTARSLARLTLFIPLCACQKHHRHHSVNGIFGYMPATPFKNAEGH